MIPKDNEISQLLDELNSNHGSIGGLTTQLRKLTQRQIEERRQYNSRINKLNYRNKRILERLKQLDPERFGPRQ